MCIRDRYGGERNLLYIRRKLIYSEFPHWFCRTFRSAYAVLVFVKDFSNNLWNWDFYGSKSTTIVRLLSWALILLLLFFFFVLENCLVLLSSFESKILLVLLPFSNIISVMESVPNLIILFFIYREILITLNW